MTPAHKSTPERGGPWKYDNALKRKKDDGNTKHVNESPGTLELTCLDF
jgi:hypothetical protein